MAYTPVALPPRGGDAGAGAGAGAEADTQPYIRIEKIMPINAILDIFMDLMRDYSAVERIRCADGSRELRSIPGGGRFGGGSDLSKMHLSFELRGTLVGVPVFVGRFRFGDINRGPILWSGEYRIRRGFYDAPIHDVMMLNGFGLPRNMVDRMTENDGGPAGLRNPMRHLKLVTLSYTFDRDRLTIMYQNLADAIYPYTFEKEDIERIGNPFGIVAEATTRRVYRGDYEMLRCDEMHIYAKLKGRAVKRAVARGMMERLTLDGTDALPTTTTTTTTLTTLASARQRALHDLMG
jgi:hypothetical protein